MYIFVNLPDSQELVQKDQQAEWVPEAGMVEMETWTLVVAGGTSLAGQAKEEIKNLLLYIHVQVDVVIASLIIK